MSVRLPYSGSALQQACWSGSPSGHRAHDPGRHLRRPVALLIPRQQVAGEREREHEAAHQQPGQPVELARLAIRAGERRPDMRCSTTTTTIADEP